MADAKIVTITAAGLVEAHEYLSRRDKTMARLIAATADRPIKLHARETPFETLAISVINQQLSQKAADTIETRVRKLAALNNGEAVLKVAPQQLRDAGLSWRKIEYLRGLAEAAGEGKLERRKLARLDDEAVIARLTELRGIGKWTAEMFLMFCLRRPDVVSLGDAGLLRAARIQYAARHKGLDDAALLDKVARRWRPWRTVACWHLWRSLDATPNP